MPFRILYITPCSPSLRTGGGRHCYANLRALCSYPGAKIDYIGPGLDFSLPGLNRDHFQHIIARDFALPDKINAALHLVSSSLIGLFNEFKRAYKLYGYQIAFIEFTRCGFVFSDLEEHTKKICNVHNVEADYFTHNRAASSWLAGRNICSSERKTLNFSNILLVMHDEDRERLQELYNIDGEAHQFILHPVCSFSPKQLLLPMRERDRVIFFAGSLDQPFNEMGLREFLKKSWVTLDNTGYLLKVAGRNPSANLLRFLSKQKNVDVIANPPDMEKLLRNARVLILPDLTGTGMKLRVAEALSLGVPVVGTDKGLRGYENVSQCGYSVPTVSDMTEPIRNLMSDEIKLESLASSAAGVWKLQYSFEVFCKRIHSILNRINKL